LLKILLYICIEGSVSDPGSGMGLDPDSIRSEDPYPDPESGYRRSKMTHKKRKKISNFMF
jgi:hypothetical protein